MSGLLGETDGVDETPPFPMVNTFFGLNVEQWADALERGELPYSDFTGARLTTTDLVAGIVAMLRRLDEGESPAP